ncbi:MAG TPA: hypothetical protein VMS17_29220 [Gemmataceae bacterium]|nr:hypothetical protein [Gemmataceae bacterium]
MTSADAGAVLAAVYRRARSGGIRLPQGLFVRGPVVAIVMADGVVHPCQCADCLAGADHPDRELYGHMNLLASRLDEQQRPGF